MQKAWRERNLQARIKAAHQALEEDEGYATCFVLCVLCHSITSSKKASIGLVIICDVTVI